MCGNKVIPKETKKEIEEMVKNRPCRCTFHKLQKLQFVRVEISSYFVFHFLSLFPQVFQMPFLASIKVYSSLSALHFLSLSLSLFPSQAIHGIFPDKTHQNLRLKPACLHATQNEQHKFKGLICCQVQKTLTEVTQPCLRGYQNS